MATRPPLARKLLILIGSLLTSALLVGTLIFTGYESVALRKGLLTQLGAQAEMLAVTAEPPLRFENPGDGVLLLSSLRGSKQIRKASLFTASGALFATYPSGLNREAFPGETPKEAIGREVDGTMEYFSPIRSEGELLGWIYIQSGLEEVHQRIRLALLVQAAIFLGILALVLVLVPRLQRSISGPIHQLAETASAIKASEDYSLRVEVEGSVEELHTLGLSFNDMVEKLQTHKEHLEGEVEARTQELVRTNRDLIEAKNKAEEASKAKSAFLAGMSHELRTPLNAVLGFAQIMAREPGRSPHDRTHLTKIMGAGEHLLTLINDVLSVARIESQRMSLNPQPFEMRLLIDAVYSMIQIRTKAKGLSFDVEVDPALPQVILADETKLRQVLLNLLGNAVKFTQAGGIGLRVFALPGDWARFEVVDTGHGIAPEELGHLFESFMQTDSGRRSAEGSGLGLHLSQAFVDLMGGKICVKSELGKGSTFSFDIPFPACFEAPKTAPARFRYHLEPGQKSQRHLVADDKDDNRELLQELLGSSGFTVQAVKDGKAAIEAWERWQPDVIWMDMRMPILDGFEATRQIRALEAKRGLPRTVIFSITASVFEHNREAVLAAGCDAMIGKPFREEELFELVERTTGVRFLRHSINAVQAPPPAPADINALDPEWRKAFLNALAMGDTEEGVRLVDELPEAMVGLAEKFRSHLEAFQMEELERLLSPEEAL